ncbi:tyrosine-type recombinase/integrase [Azospirillum canadense]|uniref:tyrosine-type recombinase/integrase n=1 Tax=Azospirillum canadense TaxID=403962 RepID=UPI002227807E|nr:site-specific integrase [Azospirillum canadense]MCW2238220.1 integrase/recombinase XerD [Azospirillum canadense]MCW2238229.1 integrase/recombinase XerD [Azospirillum canadense]
MAGKQAKVLTVAQSRAVLMYLSGTRNAARDTVMFLLSAKAGLRAREVAMLTWSMVMDANSDIAEVLALEDRAAKMRSGRQIPLNRDLRQALIELHRVRRPRPEDPVIYSERGRSMSAGSVVRWFHDLYTRLGFTGCSSHSGRRTFITAAARKASTVGGSLKDVMEMAGHRSLQTTSRYIEGDSEAKRKLVDLV